jgi:hypothetical protein
MTTADYRDALAAAIKEYEALGQQRRDVDDRLAQLAQTITTLSRLVGLTPTVPLGLTDAIRLVMRSGVPMTPVEVRDRLLGMGFDLEKYANDLAAIHTILKRLNASGELRFISRAPGRHQYTLNRPSTVAALGPDIVRFMRENAAERDAMRATDVDDEPPPARKRTGPRARRGR